MNSEAMEVESAVDDANSENTGEICDSDEGLIEDDNIVDEPRYENKSGAFTTGINIFGQEEQRRREERAKRFGIEDKNKETADNGEDLYTSMGVIEDRESRKSMRLDVIHMRGTREMSTEDVFKYFEHYQPASIEWINDISCNVVWMDNISAARALLGLSKKISGLSERLEVEAKGRYADEGCLVDVGDPKNGNCVRLEDVDCPLPPGLWRKGIDAPKSNGIFLRFATRSDEKQMNAEKMSEYYKKYGNPNFGGMRGILTETRKRQYRQLKSTKSRRSTEIFDDDEKGKNPWGELSENWGAQEDVEDVYIKQLLPTDRGNIKERLGAKVQGSREAEQREMEERTIEVSSESEGSSDSDEEWAKRSKVPRMRMHADDEEEKMKKKKMKMLSQKKAEESSDLRSRLGRRKAPTSYREDIQIIVTTNPEKYRSRREVDEIHEEELPDAEREDEVIEEMEEDVEEVEPVQEEIESPASESQLNSSSSSSDSDISEKEVQGPKGSVIKVVPRSKPTVASTVWARLNYKSQNANGEANREKPRQMKADLRSRLGQPKRERSPLRIEVRNEKFRQRNSD